MMVLVGMAVLGVDVGRLTITATETQTAVDASAVSYAWTMLDNEVDGTFDNPKVHADMILRANSIDGKRATMADVDYAIGTFNFESRKFRPGGFPANAVRADGVAQVDNVFAPIFGAHSSDVNRFAVAAYGGVGKVQPTLPIALGDCYFKEFQRSDDCSDLPQLQQVPDNEENSCFTSLAVTAANSSDTMRLLPAECCAGGTCGGGELSGEVAIGDHIDVVDGALSKVMQVLGDCVRQGITEFLIPIVKCGTCNRQMEVVGFATVDIKRVRATGRDGKGLDLEGICSATAAGGGAGNGGSDGNFGTMTVSLVQ